MRTALYARVSSMAQGEEDKASIPEQVSRIEEYCQKKGYGLIDRYIDIGYSGSRSKRPEFQRMLTDAKQGKFDVIVCWKADRLSRGMYPAAALMEVIEPLEIKLEAVEEHLDINYFSMLAVVGKIELDNLRARTMMGKVGKAKAGKLFSGRSNKLMGYDYDKGLGTRVINESEAAIIRDIFQWYAKDNLTLQGICLRLMAQGIHSPSGNRQWGTSTLHKILTNESYIGHTFAFTQKHIKKDDTIHVHHRPRSEWVEIEGATPALIDTAIFEKAQNRLQRNKELALRNTKHDYLLRGFVYCKKDGKRYQGALKRYATKQGIKEYLYYRCSSPFKLHSCSNPSWKAEHLEDIVWKQVYDVVTKPKVVTDFLKSVQADDTNVLQEELTGTESRLKALDEEQYALLDQSLRGFPKEIVIAENKNINAKRDELSKRKAELESRIETARRAKADIEGIKKACDIVVESLTELTLENKRIALEALKVKVWLDGDTITIEGTTPTADGAIASTPTNRNGERMPSISACQLTQSGQSIPLA